MFGAIRPMLNATATNSLGFTVLAVAIISAVIVGAGRAGAWLLLLLVLAILVRSRI